MDRKSCWSLFRFGFGLLARSPWAPAGFAKASPSAGREALPLIIFRYQNQKTRPGALIELWRALVRFIDRLYLRQTRWTSRGL